MRAVYRLAIVSHTHWDPEWYSTYQEYRIRLVKLMDKLLHILKTEPDYKHFMLDGQVSVIEDYLEIRPEKEEEIRDFVKSGRLLIGPWYILPEEFMVSPESHIRNLQLGHEMGGKLGGVMKVGYLCDMPGHISQLPQILRGFGIDSVFGVRGIQGYPATEKSEFTWRSPDGSEVLMICRGYNTIIELPADRSRALEMIERLGHDLSKSATTRHILLPDGDDHREPVAEIASLVHSLNGKLGDMEIVHTSLPAYIESVREERPKLAVHDGELRATKSSFIFTSGILATRMGLKTAHRQSEVLLEQWAEPFSAFSWLLSLQVLLPGGSTYPRALLRQSWKYLLRNNFHDVIYGGHVDGVTADAVNRYKASREISAWLTQEALYHIAGKIDTTGTLSCGNGLEPQPSGTIGESVPAGSEDFIVVFNPCGWANTEVIDVDFYADPASSGNLVIRDDNDEPIPFQLNHVELVHKLTSDKGLVDGKIWRQPGTEKRKFSISLLADSIPAIGYKCFSVTGAAEKTGTAGMLKTARVASFRGGTTRNLLFPESCTKADFSLLRIGERDCENEYLRLEINANGTLNITDKASENGDCPKRSGWTVPIFKGLNYFEDSGDVGDHYFYSPPGNDRVVTTLDEKAVVKLVRRGPVEAMYKIATKLRLPRISSEKGRSGRSVTCPVTSYISLRLGSKRVDITTVVNNRAKDHRLRVVFPTGIQSGHCYADSHFDVVKREISPPEQPGWLEQPSGMGPQRLFMSISDGDKGITLINKGIPQYEVSGDGTVYITLLRCISHLAKYYLPQYGGSGGMDFPVLATPGTQEPGEHTFRYSIYPHRGDWQSARSHLQAVSFNAGMKAMQTVGHGGELPSRLGFVSVSPPELVLSAVKRSEKGDGLIVRFHNSSGTSVTGSIRLFREFKEVCKVNLLEEPVEQDGVARRDNRSVEIAVGPHKIVTLKFVL
ncbi:MAG: glycoside hydrolase family 38 C-terminal domain-containing protein [Armatimonadota bacterium]|nr:glycoside hydrolase family 38 C-terminal domain-containing protein [Armatimonadota bacterium]